MVFNPSKIDKDDYESAASRAPKQDDIYKWLETAKKGFYALDDDKDCPQLGGSGSSCGLSSKIRSRAKSLNREVKMKHDKKKDQILLDVVE